MAAVVSSTLAASPWMFSATSSLVAAISRIEEDDSSALWASTSTLSAMPLREAIISPIEVEVSMTRAETVPTPLETAEPLREMRSITTPTPPVTLCTRDRVMARFSPMRFSDSARVPSSSSLDLEARAVRSQSDTRRATPVMSPMGPRTKRVTSR
jgi:hypothetical protein